MTAAWQNTPHPESMFSLAVNYTLQMAVSYDILTFVHFGYCAALSLLLLPVLCAQQTATLSGTVTDSSGAAVSGALLTLSNAVTRYESTVATDLAGTFSFTNIPFQDYVLTVRKAGFAEARRTVALRSPIPVRLQIPLNLAAVGETVSVSAFDTADLVDAEATGTRVALSMSAAERTPIPVGTRGLEAVLLSFPGFSQNANGAIHPRGAHNQMTFVIDGMPISDQLTGSFASALDPSIAHSLELFTGNVPAEFGNKVSGVASVITRSGLGSGRRFTGQIEAQAASFDTAGNVTQVAGESGRLGYFASIFSIKSNRFLDQVSIDNLHNGGNAERGYTRLDYQAGSRDILRLHALAGRSSFQLANLRSQHANGQQQRQLLRDAAFWIGWLRTLTPVSTIESTASYRTNIAQLFPSAGDTPVTAGQARHLSTLTLNTRYTRILGPHTLRAGADWQHTPVSENFSFAITNPAFNAPFDPGFRETLLPYDLTRGGRRFHFSAMAAGNLYSGFLQDNVRFGRFSLALGLRYDNYRFLVNGAQLQPRLGVAWHLRETGTVFRASYNRNYQTPPNENLLLSSSEHAAALAPAAVREALGDNVVVRIRPERQNVYEVGIQQALLGRASLNLAYYHKNSRDQQDNDNFLNTGIIFPVTLSRIRVNGVEARLVLPEFSRISGSLSVTHAKAVSTPPFTGGLFLNDGAVEALTDGPFVIDHDQKLGVQGNLIYRLSRSFWISSTLRYDSGLVSNPSDPDEVASDPDFFDLLPYVDLASDPPRVRPRTIADLAFGYSRYRNDRRLWEIQVQLNNLTNQTALYNFQSIFVGTRLVPPRMFGAKLRYYW
jgi:hypothetical protein